MPERETIAATLAAALLQSMPSPPGQRPGQPIDVTAVCRHAVSLYETILGTRRSSACCPPKARRPRAKQRR
jgi:hypothetical protein